MASTAGERAAGASSIHVNRNSRLSPGFAPNKFSYLSRVEPQWEYDVLVVYGAVDGPVISWSTWYDLSIVVGLFVYAWCKCGVCRVCVKTYISRYCSYTQTRGVKKINSSVLFYVYPVRRELPGSSRTGAPSVRPTVFYPVCTYRLFSSAANVRHGEGTSHVPLMKIMFSFLMHDVLLVVLLSHRIHAPVIIRLCLVHRNWVLNLL
jgi:hypothetical protein